MRDHARGTVRGVTNIAAFDVNVLAAADVGHADRDVLRAAEGGGKQSGQQDDVKLQSEAGAFGAIFRKGWAHSTP